MTLNLEDILIGSGIGISVVFTVLVLLVLAFIGFSKLVKYQQKVRLRKEGVDVTSLSSESLDTPAEISAVIGLTLALHLSNYFDDESNIITIKHTVKSYSPWNSKIYGLNNLHK